MSLFEPKFADCTGCLFHRKRVRPDRRNPACKSCKCGENFEPRVREREPSERELLKMLENWSHDDDA